MTNSDYTVVLCELDRIIFDSTQDMTNYVPSTIAIVGEELEVYKPPKQESGQKVKKVYSDNCYNFKDFDKKNIRFYIVRLKTK